MKKIFIQAYLKKNLGDDLFLKILLERYKKEKFQIIGPKEYKEIMPSNLKVIKNKKIINKMLNILTNNKISLKKIYSNKSDITVIIGGSMFIQSSNFYKRNDHYGKNYFIIGSNFGPYKSQEFYDKYYNIFKDAKDVCFREKYSYELFKKLKNIRYAPDVIFSLDTNNIEIKENKKVVISIIDCERKIGKEYQEIYDKKIIEIMRWFIKRNYTICLMSYCKEEGDEDAINRIIQKLDTHNKRKIETYFYNGNISEALKIMANCEVIVGSRFHSNILGLLLKKTIIPIAYSDKMINILKDIDYKGKVIDIRKMQDFNIEELTDEDITYKKDVSDIVKKAEQQFKELDKEIGRI